MPPIIHAPYGVWIRVGGVWKYAIPYIRIGTKWKQADPYVRIGNQWKRAG